MNELEALREQLKQAQLAYQMAIQINQFKTGFLGKIAHELRSPLSNVMSIHQLILSDLCENPEEERKFINQAYDAVQKILVIFDKIIAVSKIEYGTITLNVCPAQLAQVFSDLEAITHLLAANRHLQLDIIQPHPEIWVLIDRERFLQGIVTLLDTAIAHLKKGCIRVTADISEGLNCVVIIEFPGELSIWQESKINVTSDFSETEQIFDLDELEAIKSLENQLKISPATNFTLVKSLLEQMGGIIEISETAAKQLMQIKILIPLAQPSPEN